MAEVEKIAANRYRLRAHDHVFTVDAQDLLDLMDYGLRWAKTLEQEAKLERMAKQAQAQPPQAEQGETYLCVHCGQRHLLGQLCPIRTML